MRRWLPALIGLWGTATGCSAILGIEEIPESTDGGSGSAGASASGGTGGGWADSGTGGSTGGSSGTGHTLTVTIEGETGAQASVSSAPPGIDCPGSCAAQFAPGTSVTLTVTPAADSQLVAWGGACSGAASTCNLQLDASTSASVNLELRRNIMFVTSTTQQPGSFGSLDGADAICAARAQAAGLPGTYVAWLSSSTTNARNRLGSARGWVRPDGKPFVDTLFDLLDGKIIYPPRVTETGEDLKSSGGYVATGSSSQGQQSGSACADYTDPAATISTGMPAATTGRWTSYSATTCSTDMRLYCFGTDFQAPVSVTPVAGRKLFFAPSWTPGGGIASADAACQTAASGAGFSGQFVALIATTTASAPSRLDGNGANWVRPDGVPLAASVSDFLTGNLQTSPNQRADGTYVQGYAWTGADSWGALGTTNCLDWASTVATDLGRRGEIETSAPFLQTTTGTVCTSTARGLLCAEL